MNVHKESRLFEENWQIEETQSYLNRFKKSSGYYQQIVKKDNIRWRNYTLKRASEDTKRVREKISHQKSVQAFYSGISENNHHEALENIAMNWKLSKVSSMIKKTIIRPIKDFWMSEVKFARWRLIQLYLTIIHILAIQFDFLFSYSKDVRCFISLINFPGFVIWMMNRWK